MGKYAVLLIVLVAALSQPFQVAMNKKFAETTHSPVFAAVMAFACGLVLALAVWASGIFPRGQISNVVETPWWAYLTGVIGILIICGALMALPMTGAALVIAVTVFGQSVGSLVLDHYGWLGVKTIPINGWRIAGAVVILGGVLLMQKQ